MLDAIILPTNGLGVVRFSRGSPQPDDREQPQARVPDIPAVGVTGWRLHGAGACAAIAGLPAPPSCDPVSPSQGLKPISFLISYGTTEVMP